jgi:hypothetical protein
MFRRHDRSSRLLCLLLLLLWMMICFADLNVIIRR